jgi:hypothetical protein
MWLVFAEAVIELLKAGARVDIFDANGNTTLWLATNR